MGATVRKHRGSLRPEPPLNPNRLGLACAGPFLWRRRIWIGEFRPGGARAKAPLLKPHPVHDWSSHAADSFRYLALTLDRQATHSGFHRRIEYAQHGVV